MPLVFRTQIAHGGTGLRAVIEAPVKTMNIDVDGQKYQVDTGTLCLPDLSCRHEPVINCLKMAFVAFNGPCHADFITEEPTNVIDDGHECVQVLHYSGRTRMPAQNVSLATHV